MRVLFINADPEQGLTTSSALSKQACTVDWVRDVLSAQGSVLSHIYDLIVLDVKTLHHSDVQIEDLVPFGQSRLLLLNDLNWTPAATSPRCACGCAEEHTHQPLTISELLAQVRGLAR